MELVTLRIPPRPCAIGGAVKGNSSSLNFSPILRLSASKNGGLKGTGVCGCVDVDMGGVDQVNNKVTLHSFSLSSFLLVDTAVTAAY